MNLDLNFYLIIAIAIWLVILTFFLIYLFLHYNKLTKGVSQKDLISALNRFISQTETNSDAIKELSERLDQNIEDGKEHFQRLGFVRYNPFTDTGGDQSFSLCLLDEKGDGIVISSLHSRENTRLYSKQISSGQVENQVLSKEEQQVIKQALK